MTSTLRTESKPLMETTSIIGALVQMFR